MDSCFECGEELWSPAESRGYCVLCQLRAMRDDDEPCEDTQPECEEPK